MSAHVYHWKHGWIPLDHTAALSKAKGNREVAARMLADATSTSAGIHNRRDVARALLRINTVPDEHRHAAFAQVRDAAPKHGSADLLPGHTEPGGAEVGRDLQKSVPDREVVGFTDDLDAGKAAEVANVWKSLVGEFPQIPGGLRVESQGTRRDGVVSAKASALKIGDEYHIAGISVSPRLMSSDGRADKGFASQVEHGHFVGGGDNITHSITHEFGHLLDFYTGRKLSVKRAQRKAWEAAGIEPGPDVDLWLRRNMSGYARSDRDEAIAEAFADVKLNGASASPVSLEIYNELIRLLANKG